MRSADGQMPSAAEFEAMIDRAVAAGKKTGAPTGIHVMDAATAQRRAGQGMQFIAIASDLRMMSAGMQQILQQLGQGNGGDKLVKY
jgi:4-hydroxy-2-oxoheptanedioate aldolase